MNKISSVTVIVGSQKINMGVVCEPKGLTYSGSATAFVPVVNKEGETLMGFTITTRKDGTLGVTCPKVIQVGRSGPIASGAWHDGIRYTVSVKLETDRLALVTLRLEYAMNDTQSKLAAYLDDDREVIAAYRQVVKTREERAKLTHSVAVTMTEEEKADWAAFRAAKALAKAAPAPVAPPTSPIDPA